jgi:hypothetical protein
MTTPAAIPTPDLCIVKEEQFDANMMSVLSNHDGIGQDIKKQLKAYRKRAVNGNKVQVVYDYGNDLKGLREGRVYASKGLGLQSFRSDVRAALAAKYYIDIDMANAQPVLLVQLAKKHGWACSRLEEYVQNRATKLKEVMEELGCDRDGAKEFCLSILFGAKPYNTVNQFFADMMEELASIARNCEKAYPNIAKLCKTKTKPLASCLAHVIQTTESKVLRIIDAFLISKGRPFHVLIHDGGMIKKLDGDDDIQGLLREIEAHVQTQGWNIKMEVKPMEHSFTAGDESPRVYVPSSIVVSDSYAGQKLVTLMGNKMVLDSSHGRYVFDDTTGLWTQDDQALKNYLNAHAAEMIFYQVGEKADKVFDYSGCEKNIQNMFKNINRHLTPTNFVNNKGDSSIGKFLFSDGIYDMETKEFTPGFNPDILFFARIDRPFTPRHEGLIAKVRKLLFEDPYTADQSVQAKWFQRGIARALHGNYTEHKNCYITVGQPNCGRGLLTGALMEAFGGYTTVFSPNSLLYNSRSGEDDAKKLAWVVPIANTRLAIGNEITMAPGKFIDGNQLKSLAGGGDKVIARQNFKDGTAFVIRTICLLQTNDIPPIKPADEAVMNRVVINELKKSYKECPDPSNPLEQLQDTSLKAAFSSEEYRTAVFHLMTDIYHEWKADGSPKTKPECLKKIACEWVEGSSSVSGLLSSEYDITKSVDDYVVMKDLINFLRNAGCVESDTKIGRALTMMGCASVDKKVGGRTVKVRTGIKKMEAAIE